MNEPQAREILGCSPNASFKELKSAYRRLIFAVHPDKAGQDPTSQQRAKEASTRLNEAWEYIENRQKQGFLGMADTSQTSYESYSRGRAPNENECNICGYSFATKISAPFVTSFIWLSRRGKYESNACKYCGIALSRLALRESLIKGWWGLGVFLVPHAIYRYFMNMRALKKINLPNQRDPEVITLTNTPFFVPKSPFREPLPWITSAIAIYILYAILSSPAPTTTPSKYFGEVGTCYKTTTTSKGEQVVMVDCTNSEATLKSVAVVDSATLCPPGTLGTTDAALSNGSTKTACLMTK